MVTGPDEKVKTEYTVAVNLSGLSDISKPDWFADFIVTTRPENGISFNTSANWDAPFSAGAEGLSNISQAITDGEITNQFKFFQKQLWQGSDPIEVDLDLQFVTHSDPYDDVVRPAMSLLLTTLPRELDDQGNESWTLQSPVTPSINDGGEGETISIEGEMVSFPFVIPTSVDTDFSQTLCSSPKGGAYPVSCELNFSFITSEAPTRQNFGINLRKPGGFFDEVGQSSEELDEQINQAGNG